VKFTPEGGFVDLSVQVRDVSGDTYTIEVAVKDSGIGISQEQQARLFNSFEQADGSISRKFGGTGLGLAISKKIVEMMGGRIWIESEIGKGARFAFTFKAPKGNSTGASLVPFQVDWRKIQILVVDDEASVLEFFGKLANDLGFHCGAAADGATALRILEKCERGYYAIIFVDWKMPEMDGIELTRRIKELEGGDVVVTMISAIEWDLIAAKAKEAGVDEFVPKPLFSSSLINCISDCLSKYKDIKQLEKPREDGKFFQGKHILLAEDVEINREILLALLEDTGIAIDCAENGQEAVYMFEGAPDAYDAILMDIHMPEMDGFMATRSIRALPCAKAATIPIIAMTANVFREDIEKCLASGMNDHLGKPIVLDDVIAKLKTYLDISV
jgi:CheY-like chemotaxis protein